MNNELSAIVSIERGIPNVTVIDPNITIEVHEYDYAVGQENLWKDKNGKKHLRYLARKGLRWIPTIWEATSLESFAADLRQAGVYTEFNKANSSDEQHILTINGINFCFRSDSSQYEGIHPKSKD